MAAALRVAVPWILDRGHGVGTGYLWTIAGDGGEK